MELSTSSAALAAARSCSACHTQSETLARCSRCKWSAYCSKPCQQTHWRAGHRHSCAQLQVCGRFRALERQWWASRPAAEMQTLMENSGLQPDAMSFFGELLFLFLGLKACVLLSNLPPAWRTSFVSDVVHPSGVLQASDVHVELLFVATRLQTPAEYELTGDLVLAATAHVEFPRAQQQLRLAAMDARVEDVALGSARGETEVAVVQEAELARVLDYPVALSECREPMVEVGYFLGVSAAAGGAQVLTSYCADPRYMARVRQHFARYRQRCMAAAGVELVLRQTAI